MDNLDPIWSWIIGLPKPPKRSRKRKLSTRSSEEVQQLVSPPASLADYTFGEMSSTPKRPRLDDLDATPRPGISSPSDRLSRSASETSSTASRTPSTRRQMMSLRLNELGVECKALDVDAAPDAAQELVSRMEDIGRALYILPHSLQSTIFEKLKCRNLEARKWMHSFKDAGDEDRLPGRIPTFEEVEKIHRKANECQEYNHEETSWNSQVHLRLLESIYEEPFGGQCGTFNAITCTTARPHRQFKPASSPFKMIDICVYAAFEAEAELSAIIRQFCGVTPTQTVNHTDFEPLSTRPILISIETKKPGVHWDTAQLQIGSWHAAQWSFLRWAVGQRILRQRAEKEMGTPLTDEEEQALEADKLATLSTLGVLPGIIIQGHRWLLVLSTYEDGKTKLWADHQFGTTQSCLEIYAVVAGVRQLTAWARDIYIPWFRANILD